MKGFIENWNRNICKYVISKDLMTEWYKSIANDMALFDEEGRILFDYEVADEIGKYIDFGCKVDIKAPYILFKNVLLPIDVLAAFMYVDESAIIVLDKDSCIMDCRDVIDEEVVESVDNKSFAKDLLSFIYDYGEKKNLDFDDMQVFNSLCEKARDLLDLDVEVVLAAEEGVIAIAVEKYISDAKEAIGIKLGLNPKCFIEVSNPWSTVLLIDCKYIALSNEYCNAEDEEWLY